MAEQSNAENLRLLNKKLALTLDEYYEQHVRGNTSNLNSNQSKQSSCYIYDSKIMELTLDEYYKQCVLPKFRLQAAKEEAEQRRSHYQRTHYFGPGYFKQPKE